MVLGFSGSRVLGVLWFSRFARSAGQPGTIEPREPVNPRTTPARYEILQPVRSLEHFHPATEQTAIGAAVLNRRNESRLRRDPHRDEPRARTRRYSHLACLTAGQRDGRFPVAGCDVHAHERVAAVHFQEHSWI